MFDFFLQNKYMMILPRAIIKKVWMKINLSLVSLAWRDFLSL